MSSKSDTPKNLIDFWMQNFYSQAQGEKLHIDKCNWKGLGQCLLYFELGLSEVWRNANLAVAQSARDKNINLIFREEGKHCSQCGPTRRGKFLLANWFRGDFNVNRLKSGVAIEL